MKLHRTVSSLLAVLVLSCITHAEQPPELRPWLDASQVWHRDTDGPIVSLGDSGAFDDTHIFAPMVAHDANGSTLRENGKLRMWFSSTWFGNDYVPSPSSHDSSNVANEIVW